MNNNHRKLPNEGSRFLAKKHKSLRNNSTHELLWQLIDKNKTSIKINW